MSICAWAVELPPAAMQKALTPKELLGNRGGANALIAASALLGGDHAPAPCPATAPVANRSGTSCMVFEHRFGAFSFTHAPVEVKCPFLRGPRRTECYVWIPCAPPSCLRGLA